MNVQDKSQFPVLNFLFSFSCEGRIRTVYDDTPGYEPGEMTTSLLRDIEPLVGIEPTTYGLQNRCSAD